VACPSGTGCPRAEQAATARIARQPHGRNTLTHGPPKGLWCPPAKGPAGSWRRGRTATLGCARAAAVLMSPCRPRCCAAAHSPIRLPIGLPRLLTATLPWLARAVRPAASIGGESDATAVHLHRAEQALSTYVWCGTADSLPPCRSSAVQRRSCAQTRGPDTAASPLAHHAAATRHR
jgi:hypothetical protein